MRITPNSLIITVQYSISRYELFYDSCGATECTSLLFRPLFFVFVHSCLLATRVTLHRVGLLRGAHPTFRCWRLNGDPVSVWIPMLAHIKELFNKYQHIPPSFKKLWSVPHHYTANLQCHCCVTTSYSSLKCVAETG